MPRRRPGAFDTWQLDDPRLQDYSPELWDESYGTVARKLLTSAVRCYAAKGFQATTTRDISKGAGLSPAAMYVHFSSKEHMLFEISRIGHRTALEAIQVPAEEDVAAELRAVVSRHVVWHARHHVAARVCQYQLADLSPEHYEEIRQIRRQSMGVYHDVIARGIDLGAFVPTEVKRIARGIIALAIDLVRWYRLSGPDSPEELGEAYATLAVTMVTNAAPAPATTPTGALLPPRG